MGISYVRLKIRQHLSYISIVSQFLVLMVKYMLIMNLKIPNSVWVSLSLFTIIYILYNIFSLCLDTIIVKFIPILLMLFMYLEIYFIDRSIILVMGLALLSTIIIVVSHSVIYDLTEKIDEVREIMKKEENRK